MTRTALYRFFDCNDDLLYVGISLSPLNRWAQHKADKPWIEDVASTTIDWHDTRAEALEAERRAIIEEHPLYNVTHNTGRPTPPALISVVCSECGGIIDDGDGCLEVDALAAGRLARSIRRGWLSMYDDWKPVPWQAWHWWCDPNPEDESIPEEERTYYPTYHFEVSEVRTLAGLIRWTVDLRGKAWIDGTNWDDVLELIGTGDGILCMDPAVLGLAP